MKIVLDTNVLIMSLPTTSKYRPIFDSLIEGKYNLAISNSILEEYLEIIARKTTPQISENVGKLLVNMHNVEKTIIYFYWQLIQQDYDDNKFIDCAVAANVKFVVTNDKHFNILKNINFPPIEVINADDFLKELELL